jgi:hypothetical protein
MIPYTDVAAIIAVIWSVFQQYQINQICKNCPYHPANAKKFKDDDSLSTAS